MALVTLQFGNYSNSVGAHWWNVQESSFCSESRGDPSSEVLHGCLYREARKGARKEVTYEPRLIAVGLPSSPHSTATEDQLYGEDKGWSSALGWDGDVQTIVQESAPHKEFLTYSDNIMDVGTPPPKDTRVDSGVRAWSDYLCPQLHPQSLLPVPVRTTRE